MNFDLENENLRKNNNIQFAARIKQTDLKENSLSNAFNFNPNSKKLLMLSKNGIKSSVL